MQYDKQMMMISLMVDDLQQSITNYKMIEMVDGQVRASWSNNVDKNSGVNKTAIRRKILEIRQDLLELDKCFR